MRDDQKWEVVWKISQKGLFLNHSVILGPVSSTFWTLGYLRTWWIEQVTNGFMESQEEVEAVDPTCTVIFKEKKLSVRLYCYYDILLESSNKYFGPIFYFGNTEFHHVGIKLTILRKFWIFPSFDEFQFIYYFGRYVCIFYVIQRLVIRCLYYFSK